VMAAVGAGGTVAPGGGDGQAGTVWVTSRGEGGGSADANEVETAIAAGLKLAAGRTSVAE
jgi:hypothetical protein